MSRRPSSLVAALIQLPWWASMLVAAGVYGLVAFALPLLFSLNAATAALSDGVGQSAWIFGIASLLPAPFAAYGQYRRRKSLDGQYDLTTILDLGWRDFESLVAELFHRHGYSVAQKGGASPDGGIDIVLNRAHERVLVQCKHWRAHRVGVSAVREVLGLMATERASGCALVTSGSFSDDAQDFARGKAIQLIDGRRLEQMIRAVKISVPARKVAPASITVSCPECGTRMVKRIARKGILAGTQFWGCSRFPSCTGVRQLA